MTRLADFVRGSGLTKIVYKTDQEYSVRAVAERSAKEAEIKDRHIKDSMEETIKKSGRTGAHLPSNVPVPEFSAVGKSASNGRVGRAVQMVEDQLRWEITSGGQVRCQDSVQSPCHSVDGWALCGRDQQALH